MWVLSRSVFGALTGRWVSKRWGQSLPLCEGLHKSKMVGLGGGGCLEEGTSECSDRNIALGRWGGQSGSPSQVQRP